jgi:hypothetical protein
MSTTITWNGSPSSGGQTATFSHPQELKSFGYPKPPLQPIASWAADLSTFQAWCTDGVYAAALAHLVDHYFSATTSDVPGGALAGFKAYVQATFKGGVPNCLLGSAGSWRTDGADVGKTSGPV